MEHTCNTCYYNTGRHKTGCERFYELQENCSSWADEEEAKKREEEIKEYRSIALPMNCESVKDILDKHFMRLYQNNYNDIEIASALKVSASSVGEHRRSLDLKAQNKRKKPAGTGK